MPSPDLSAEPSHDAAPEVELAEAGAYASERDAFQHSLVVLAMGHECWIAPSGDLHRVLVRPHLLTAAREQLAKFDRESLGWPPAPFVDAEAPRQAELIGPLLWSATVLAIYHLEGKWPGWWQIGALDSQAVFNRGEWWRIVTALFLHGNPAHVISNALSGIPVFCVLLTTIGRRRGWLLLALASICGNLAVAAINYPNTYRSVGASTAIFAGLGLLTGRAIRGIFRHAGRPRRWRAAFVPLAAGVTVLGLYGAGDVRVDVGAHLTGFVAGVLLGFAAGRPGRSSEPRS